MNPPCAFCKKTVYPTEKFNCLDKIWHKGCFKCTECSLKLTMSTYKGFNKMPYCNAHYPKLKATQVAQTAEQTRLKKISNQQSQVLYHKDFNQAKGAKISVVDDPALKTQRAASQNQSLAAYHGLAQKKADQEMRRPAQEDEPEQEYDPVKELESDGISPSLFFTKYSIQDDSQELSIQAGQAPRQIGSIHDMKVEDDNQGYAPQQQQQPPPPSGGGYRPPPPEPVQQQQSRGPVYRAMYDYAAADVDEVSFVEGDVIINSEAIDEGWMTGTVERTGDTGMMPSNYVEPI
ncbi:LIM and SH3 domain protein 1-like isoform X5 [Amphiura filiformis]|uniref:LIM and SH3 domain protein 1-like isoform X5 n=1 Tax=Amphiura filiformis TaxID=82378 RepID=UPI003B224D4F